MVPLTFLQAKMPLAKQFLRDGQKNYPLAKNFTSFSYEVEPDNKGLQDFSENLRAHALLGNCFFKGELREPLVDEPRAGKTLSNNHTQLLVIDIDKYELPSTTVDTKHDKDSLEKIAEQVIQRLPTELQGVSYVAQASASLGVRTDAVSLHLFFWLDEPVPPQMLKWWLTSLNLTLPGFVNQVSLTPAGHALAYPIDRCMAENSRIIYIAPPKFDALLKNPFEDNGDRIVFVEKRLSQAMLASKIRDVKPPLIQHDIDSKIKSLREAAGLPDTKGKTKLVRVGNGVEEHVLTNPDRAVLQYAYHNDTFCYANLNNGDSNAYYWPLDNPRWVFNFKDEPVFEMSKVDPDFYKWYLREFRDFVVKHAKLKPLVFRDFITDAYYTVEYDPTTNAVERFATAARQSLQDFCSGYWEPLPDPIPTWDTFFDPSCKPGIDFEENQLNLFYPSPFMQAEIDEYLQPEDRGIRYGMARESLERVAPNIMALVLHVAGDGRKEFEHFINWLACAFVERNKTNIAWIFHGIEGTGKGILFHRVLQPLFGKRYSVMKRINDLEDSFDGWREQNLLTVIDEFRLADTAQQSRMHDKIKNMISEPYGSVRYMRANAKEVPLFSNHIFFSNNEDAMRLSASDRRFCVAPRQMRKIDHVHNVGEMLPKLDEELMAFAAFLNAFEIDQEMARVALDNESKQEMRSASNTWVDDFCGALGVGNFEYFVDNALLFQPTRPEDTATHAQVKRIIAGWAVDAIRRKTSTLDISVEELRMVYFLMSGKEERTAAFTKVLTRRGMKVTKDPSTKVKTVTIKWDFSSYDLTKLITDHASPEQRATAKEMQTH